MTNSDLLFSPLTLPCGVTLKNRIAKSAMSDSLGDGTGHPSDQQIALYDRWSQGGLALAIIGEVQTSPNFAEKPGNLVLDEDADLDRFRMLAQSGSNDGSQLWLQLGHAGALSYLPTSVPKGPSALDLPELNSGALTLDEIHQFPADLARTARLAKQAGFGGVQIHAAHGFLLSQFLSPLFNKRTDEYGGPIANRMRLLIESIATTRAAVGPDFPIGVKINSSDMLEGGLSEDDVLEVMSALDQSTVDLIDISGGTYFPGAKAASDGAGKGPYFTDFARQARKRTTKPLMLTGGIKTHEQAKMSIEDGIVDVVGLARAFVLEPALVNQWKAGNTSVPKFPKFVAPPEGGITAWYTMQITNIADGNDTNVYDLNTAITEYEKRDGERTQKWLAHFRLAGS